MRLLLLAVVLVGCSDRNPPSEDAAADARTDGPVPDATTDVVGDVTSDVADAIVDAEHDDPLDASLDVGADGCGDCNDDNACTEDVCTPEGCANMPLTGTSCDLDGDLCTRDECRDGMCLEGTTCPLPQTCDAEVGCVCPFPGELKPCGDACISIPTCCDDAECVAPETCPGAGSFCGCPAGSRLCDERCIDFSMCCDDTDCGLGRTCVDNTCVAT